MSDFSSAPSRVLIVDDDESMCRMLAAGLDRRGYAVTWKTAAAAALEAVAGDDFAVILTDVHMRGMDGLELCRRLADNRPDVPVIVLTAFGSLDTAVAAIRAGAYDFITKPADLDVVALALERAVRHGALRAEVKRLRDAVAAAAHCEELIGASAAMQEVYELIARVAATDATVLVTGETGTGKEMVARAIHRRSRRREGPFVALNCAAVPEHLLESELFGHLRGAFTDARVARAGLLSQADGGTLFLDEIGDMPLALQPKLLRALQERAVRPVGGDTEVSFDARVIVATNRDLETAVEERRFRADLYYRINVIHLALPALRARGSDVLLLAQHFLSRFAAQAGKQVTALSSAAAERLLAYSWPGNVRELENCMERAVALARYAQVHVEDLPEKIRDYRPSHVLLAAEDPSELVPMEEVERRYVLRVLDAVGGNKREAARILGFDRKTLYRKLERYGLPPASRQDEER
jgi:two-component system response regulator HydG